MPDGWNKWVLISSSPNEHYTFALKTRKGSLVRHVEMYCISDDKSGVNYRVAVSTAYVPNEDLTLMEPPGVNEPCHPARNG